MLRRAAVLKRICDRRRAQNAAHLEKASRLNQFPEACCGQASDILARFLGEQGIYTKVVSGSDSNTTHAWLVLDDSILQKNIQRAEEATDYEEVNKMNRILEGYG